MPDFWDIGEDVPLTATFADDDSVLYDPDTVTFEHISPEDGARVLFTWTAAVPGTDIVKLSVGTFRVRFRPDARGYWHWKWIGTGPTLVRVIESDSTTSIPVRATQFA